MVGERSKARRDEILSILTRKGAMNTENLHSRMTVPTKSVVIVLRKMEFDGLITRKGRVWQAVGGPTVPTDELISERRARHNSIKRATYEEQYQEETTDV